MVTTAGTGARGAECGRGFESGHPWHVLHVRSRCEKKALTYCGRHGIDTYLPLRHQTRTFQRRKVTTSLPVFPGYLFAAFPPDLRMAVLQSNMVARILVADDQVSLVRQLRQVDSALLVDPRLGAHPELVRGQHVRIIDGPFRGIEGVVESIPRPTRVFLNVTMIGQSIVVETAADQVELLDRKEWEARGP